MGAVNPNRALVFGLLASLGCAADLATKGWIFGRLGMPGGERIWIWQPYLSLETHLNEGALFGMGQGRQMVFASLSVAAVVFIVYLLFVRRAAHDWLLTIALGAITGGIGGNLYDRIGLPKLIWQEPGRVGQPVYAVRDWIHFRVERAFDFPVFNVADSLLVCGAILLVLHALRTPEPERSPALVDVPANRT